jgi:hypothetical protein
MSPIPGARFFSLLKLYQNLTGLRVKGQIIYIFA